MMISTKQAWIFRIVQSLSGLAGLIYADWRWVLLFWLFAAIGNGTVGHRYFAHGSFEVSKIGHWILSLWCSLAAYSPPIYWQVQHRHHHRHTDTSSDIHSPINGMFMALLGWAFSPSRIDSVYQDRACVFSQARALKDPAVGFASRHFIAINVIFLLLLAMIDWILALAATAATVIEQLRLGLINTLCHIPGLPGNYRNHQTDDLSQNNLLLGWISLGFGWHNNHHNDAKKLVLTEKWWEIDIEGQIGRLLGKL